MCVCSLLFKRNLKTLFMKIWLVCHVSIWFTFIWLKLLKFRWKYFQFEPQRDLQGTNVIVSIHLFIYNLCIIYAHTKNERKIFHWVRVVKRAKKWGRLNGRELKCTLKENKRKCLLKYAWVICVKVKHLENMKELLYSSDCHYDIIYCWYSAKAHNPL